MLFRSGIIVGKSDTELLIVTNAHVVDNIDNLKCVFSDGTSASCSVKGSKSDQDIAVAAVSLSDISSDTASNIAIAELEDSSDIKVGQQVVDFAPQPVITKDNVTMRIDTVVFFQITDPKLFCYGVESPIMAIENLTARSEEHTSEL